MIKCQKNRKTRLLLKSWLCYNYSVIQVFEKGKSLLLNIASPDAIVRLKYSKLADEFDAAFDMYFIKQSHSSLFELLSKKLQVPLSVPSTSEEGTSVGADFSIAAQKEMLLLQITTHSHLLSEPDVTRLCKALKIKRKNIACIWLQEFDTEMDFCNKLKYVTVSYIYLYPQCVGGSKGPTVTTRLIVIS